MMLCSILFLKPWSPLPLFIHLSARLFLCGSGFRRFGSDLKTPQQLRGNISKRFYFSQSKQNRNQNWNRLFLSLTRLAGNDVCTSSSSEDQNQNQDQASAFQLNMAEAASCCGTMYPGGKQFRWRFNS